MKIRRDISAAHPAVTGARRRTGSAFLRLLLEGAGLSDTFDQDHRDPDADFREWAARADELAECAELLHSGGYADHRSPLPLRRGEQVFLVMHDLILMPRDTGTVTITDQRVVFQSSNQAMQFLHSGKHHHDETEPMTFFGEYVIRYGTAESVCFRMRLAVAQAWANSSQLSLALALADELADHLAARPEAVPAR